jgi:hypothetical protein
VLLDRAAAIAVINQIRAREAPPAQATPLRAAPEPPKPLGPQVHDGLAVASLVLSLLWLGGLGALLAVIFADMSYREARRAHRDKSGLATAGMVLGYIGLAIAVIVIIVVVVHLANRPDPTQQWINCLNSQLNNPNITCPPAPPGG